jgi:hypothetical protein
MRRKIERTSIRFNLYDSAGRDALGGAMHQDFADALACNRQDRAGVKIARQLSRHFRRDFIVIAESRAIGESGCNCIFVRAT